MDRTAHGAGDRQDSRGAALDARVQAADVDHLLRRRRDAVALQGGLFSCWANDNLKPGMTLDVMPPMGHFNVPLAAANARRYLAFAAGSGITPILSIIKTTLLTEPNSSFTLFYGNRASSSVIFKDELADLKDLYLERLNLAYVMSREQQDIELFNGRITKEKCQQFLQRAYPGAHW